MKRVICAVFCAMFGLPGLWAAGADELVEAFYECPCGAKARVDSIVAAAPTDSLPALLQRADEQYFEPTSPDYCEGVMGLFLTAALPRLEDETERDVAQWKLESVCQINAEGSAAPDFTFDLLDGPTGVTLSQFRTEGERLLLLFYDPDCGHCAEVIDRLKELPVKVLAVCVDSTPERWAETAPSLPEAWVKAFDRSNLPETEIYLLRALPDVYLLDAQGRVELKNPAPERLINRLKQ